MELTLWVMSSLTFNILLAHSCLPCIGREMEHTPGRSAADFRVFNSHLHCWAGRPISLHWSGSKEHIICPLTWRSSPSIPQPLWVVKPGLIFTDFTCNVMMQSVQHWSDKLNAKDELVMQNTICHAQKHAGTLYWATKQHKMKEGKRKLHNKNMERRPTTTHESKAEMK